MESNSILPFGFSNRQQQYSSGTTVNSSPSATSLVNKLLSAASTATNASSGIKATNNKVNSRLLTNNTLQTGSSAQSSGANSTGQVFDTNRMLNLASSTSATVTGTAAFYESNGAANEATPPVGLEIFKYGSNTNNNGNLIVPPATDLPYITAAIATPAKAGELYMARTANLFNEEWQEQVASAIEKNGGLGTTSDGFLSFSKIGFVKLKNENLSAEQNRQLAAISLQLGIPIEDLPSRSPDSAAEDPDINRWVNDFLTEHSETFSAFLQNPQLGYSVKDGSHQYQIGINSLTGQITSGHEKIHGGIRGWCAKNMSWLSPALDMISTATSFIPGWGTAASVISSGVKAAGNMIAAGKFKASELLSFAMDSLPLFKGKFQSLGGKAVSWAEKQLGKESGWLADQVKYLGVDLNKLLGNDKTSTVAQSGSVVTGEDNSVSNTAQNIFAALEEPFGEFAEAVGLGNIKLENIFTSTTTNGSSNVER